MCSFEAHAAIFIQGDSQYLARFTRDCLFAENETLKTESVEGRHSYRDHRWQRRCSDVYKVFAREFSISTQS